MKKEVGKILIDIAKLVIGGVILAGLMKRNIEPLFLFMFGGLTTVVMIITGLLFIWWDGKQKSLNN